MDEEFLSFYNQELRVVRETAREFAEEFPGIAERLGGLLDERMDPAIAGLLEGTAFLAARVQLKLAHEFPEFTANYLDQIVPDFLAPRPSVMLVAATPPFGDPALHRGRRLPRGSYLDAVARERSGDIACRYRLTSDLELWPFVLSGADYLATPAQLDGIGVPAGPRAQAAIRLTLSVRTASRPEAEPDDRVAASRPQCLARSVSASRLTIRLGGPFPDAAGIHEHIFRHGTRVLLRHVDEQRRVVLSPLPDGALEQIGLSADEALIPRSTRLFRGHALLRDYMLFARTFLGFTLTGLAPALARVAARSFDILILLDRPSPDLAARVTPEMFLLHAAPAINLFEKTADRIALTSRTSEYQVLPDRSRPLDFEPHSVLSVSAFAGGTNTRVPVAPLYSTARDPGRPGSGLFYTLRRLPRRRSSRERQRAGGSSYTGTELYLSFLEPDGPQTESAFAELGIRVLCTNRHLPDQLPVNRKGADFHFLDDGTLEVACIAGPTPPRPPLTSEPDPDRRGQTPNARTWRLVNLLALGHHGLTEGSAEENGAALRALLSFFADPHDHALSRQVEAIRTLETRPVVRRVREGMHTGVARGVEITITLDEWGFEGGSAFLLGCVLDHFLADSIGLNHFTQTLIRSSGRGEILRGPVRLGRRRAL